MKTLPDLLREADPLAHELPVSTQARRISRQAILNAPRGMEKGPRRPVAMAAVIGGALIGISAGVGYWWLAVDVVAAVSFEVRLAETHPSDDGFPDRVVVDRRQEPVVTNSDIAHADVIPGDDASTFSVAVTFTEDGAEKLARASEHYLGRPLAILVDGEVVAAPVLRAAISNSAVITGNYTKTEAEKIAAGIIGRHVSVGPRANAAPTSGFGSGSGSEVSGQGRRMRGRAVGESDGPRPARPGR